MTTLYEQLCTEGSVTASAPQNGVTAGIDPCAQLVLSCSHEALTPKATEAGLFVVLADVGLVVPAHRGPQVLRSTDGAFPERGQRAQPGCSLAQEPLARTRHHTGQAQTGSDSSSSPNTALGWCLSSSGVAAPRGSSQPT